MQIERAKLAVNAEQFERDCTVRLLHRVVRPQLPATLAVSTWIEATALPASQVAISKRIRVLLRETGRKVGAKRCFGAVKA
jgi:hypothetical protein